MKKTVKLLTLGCKVNQYETQSISERFVKKGFKVVDDDKLADIYIINTCTVTSTADSKSKYLINKCINENNLAQVIVTGCMVEKNFQALAKIKGVSFIVSKKFFPEGVSSFVGHTRAFLKIQDGCNNLCSYCKVPIVRGASISKPLTDIINEARKLVSNGFKEIVLTGICLGSYGKDLFPEKNLVHVIEQIEKIDGLVRLRLSSIEAGDVSNVLIKKISESDKMCHHLHIPIQSGDDDILMKMNRRYNRNDYLKLIKKIKNKIPDIAITTDVLVGFPGETEKNFNNTINLLKEINPLRVHAFPYSHREEAPAAEFNEKIGQHIIKKRLHTLRNVSNECTINFYKIFLKNKLSLLIEGRCKDNPGYWEGYSGNYIKIRIKSKKDLKNKLLSVKLNKISDGFIHAVNG